MAVLISPDEGLMKLLLYTMLVFHSFWKMARVEIVYKLILYETSERQMLVTENNAAVLPRVPLISKWEC